MVKVAKTKVAFVCQHCGFASPKWVGKCPDCSSWNSFVEEDVFLKPRSESPSLSFKPVLLRDVESQGENGRTKVDIPELDRVLGGGIVRGSVVLIGGDPGIGKSTISLQLCHQLALKGKKILYVSGEESVGQTKLRADRLGARASDQLYIVNATDLDAIVAFIKKILPDLVIIDSIQVIYTSSLVVYRRKRQPGTGVRQHFDAIG